MAAATPAAALAAETMQHDTMGGMIGMTGIYGAYSMEREASGTSWQPDATPMGGRMQHRDGWMLMSHGYATAIFDTQGGPRGADDIFLASMFMAMAQRPLGDSARFGLRAMLSLDPSMGKRGYPLLFAAGETADGVTPLVDRQHPHDLFMELSAAWSQDVGRSSIFVYAGLPGEPALGPPAFMHRGSSFGNPEAPLAHHWMDSTHIAFGVATVGAIRGAYKLEASAFNGREPDQHRYDIETGALDSWSARMSWNPTPAWSLQLSSGRLVAPEQLEPDVNVTRTTASVAWVPRERWQLLLAFGRNAEREPGEDHAHASDAWQLEASLLVRRGLTTFARLERIEPQHIGSGAPVGKLTLGLSHDLSQRGAFTWSIGGLASGYAVPASLREDYGSSPVSAMLFLSVRIGA